MNQDLQVVKSIAIPSTIPPMFSGKLEWAADALEQYVASFSKGNHIVESPDTLNNVTGTIVTICTDDGEIQTFELIEPNGAFGERVDVVMDTQISEDGSQSDFLAYQSNANEKIAPVSNSPFAKVLGKVDTTALRDQKDPPPEKKKKKKVVTGPDEDDIAIIYVKMHPKTNKLDLAPGYLDSDPHFEGKPTMRLYSPTNKVRIAKGQKYRGIIKKVSSMNKTNTNDLHMIIVKVELTLL